MATDATRRSRIAAISILQKQLSMDEETLRALCLEVTGLSSRADMDLMQLTAVRDRLVAAGGKLTAPGGGRVLAPDAQARKLRALWLRGAELGILRDGSEAAMCSWASNSRAPNVTVLLSSLTHKEFYANIERLKKWLIRELYDGRVKCSEGHSLPVVQDTIKPLLWGNPLYCGTCHAEQRSSLLRWEQAAPRESRRPARRPGRGA